VGLPVPRPAPLRPLGAAEILDGAIRLVRGNARGVLTISVPWAILAAGVSALLQYAAVTSRGSSGLILLANLAVSTAFGVVLTGLLTPLLSDALLGRRIGAGESLRRVGRRAWTLVLLALIVLVAEGGGLALCLIVGAWLWGAWAVAAPAVTLEGIGVRAALGRSHSLVDGTFWRVWGLRALGWLLTNVLGLFVTLPFTLVALLVDQFNPFDSGSTADHPAVLVAITALGALVTAALLAPVSSAIDVLLYTDLRMRKEGMDIVLGLPRLPDPAATGPAPAGTGW
jgi:hypothetical protein